MKRRVLKQGYSVGPSARSAQSIGSPQAAGETKDIPVPGTDLPRGVDIGNGYTIGYKELMSLSRLRKAGVETEALFSEPKVPPPGTWTLGQQIGVMEDRRQKTLLQKKNAMLLRMQKKEQESL